MKKKVKPRVRQKKGFSKLIIALLCILLLSLILKLVFFAAQRVNNLHIASNDAKSSLQIGTFGMENPPADTPTPTPLPSATPSPLPQQPSPTPGIPVCAGNSGEPLTNAPACRCDATFFFECRNQKCVRVLAENYGGGTGQCADIINVFQLGDECQLQNITGRKDGYFCVGKPVIYLYPQKDTLVDVSVKTSGKIVISDPLYPSDGWKQVLAKPGGKLTYLGKDYSELFYESNVKDFGKPTAGITLDSENLTEELDSIITKLGLVGSEKVEFLDWWVPRLQSLHAPYIEFSVIEKAEKEKIDHVSYSPEPDTRIEFLAYFKPLQKVYGGKTLELPSTPPQRIGFTAVEWGGVIDYQN